jgi:multidrug efflux pump subunit AcrA (membrane-fusion protein)
MGRMTMGRMTMDRHGVAAAALALALSAGASWGQAAPSARPGTPGAPPSAPAAPVVAPRPAAPRIATVEPAERSQSVAVAGRLRPQSRIAHQATAAGYVSQILVREGQAVDEGAPLFSIERNEVGRTFKPVVVESRVKGVVSEVLVDLTKEVKTGDAGVVVVATDSYTLEAKISDKDAFKVAIGQKVIGRSPDGSRFAGTLTARSQEPDYQTGLFSLTFEFPRAPGASIGTMLIVDLPTDTRRGIFVNRDVLVRRYGKFYIWVVTPDNVLEAREVGVGAVYGEQIQVERGLAVGERYLSRINGREKAGAPASGEAP